MTALLKWLASKAGRALIGAGATLLALCLGVLKIYDAGKSAEKAEQDKSSLKAQRTRGKIDDDHAKMSDAELDADLSGWVRSRRDDD